MTNCGIDGWSREKEHFSLSPEVKNWTKKLPPYTKVMKA
jgi:hypothetical protein